ncbi:MAG: hypothetical protein Q7V62_14625 [Actinomycetota bacterium]|nr:hypothetical protein [Actinomycetota bacterium]
MEPELLELALGALAAAGAGVLDELLLESPELLDELLDSLDELLLDGVVELDLPRLSVL